MVETYAALIYACILAADFSALDEVYESMQQWDYDKQPAWQSTLQGLIDRWCDAFQVSPPRPRSDSSQLV